MNLGGPWQYLWSILAAADCQDFRVFKTGAAGAQTTLLRSPQRSFIAFTLQHNSRHRHLSRASFPAGRGAYGVAAHCVCSDRFFLYSVRRVDGDDADLVRSLVFGCEAEACSAFSLRRAPGFNAVSAVPLQRQQRFAHSFLVSRYALWRSGWEDPQLRISGTDPIREGWRVTPPPPRDTPSSSPCASDSYHFRNGTNRSCGMERLYIRCG